MTESSFLETIEAFVRQMLPQEGPGVVLCKEYDLYYLNADAIDRCPDINLREAMATGLQSLALTNEDYVVCLFDGKSYEIRRCTLTSKD